MDRIVHQETLTIANAAAISGAVDFRKFTTGVYHMPTGWTAAQIGFKVSQSKTGTYLPLYDLVGAFITVTTTAVDVAMPLPAQLAGCAWFKFWSQDGSAGNTNQGAARTIRYDLKG